LSTYKLLLTQQERCSKINQIDFSIVSAPGNFSQIYCKYLREGFSTFFFDPFCLNAWRR